MRVSALMRKNRQLQKMQRKIRLLQKENVALAKLKQDQQRILQENKTLKNALAREKRAGQLQRSQAMEHRELQYKKRAVSHMLQQQAWQGKSTIFAQINFSRIRIIEGRVTGLEQQLQKIRAAMPECFATGELTLFRFTNKKHSAAM